jgi:hypothetical protein
LVTQVIDSASMSTCALRKMRLASIILATVRPDAAAEPKVEAICQDEVEKVSVVKAAPSTPSEADREGGADQPVVPFAGDGGGGDIGILRGRIDRGLQLVEGVDELVGVAVDRENPAPGEVDILAADRGEAARGGFIWMAPMYWIGDACLPTWKPSIARPRSFDCAAAA